MEKYILTKTQKGKKYLYEVKDENGNVISKRTSTRDYVACTVNGDFYFGRLDLIGKGDHGKGISNATKILSNPQKALKEHGQAFIDYLVQRKEQLSKIAYLQPGK